MKITIVLGHELPFPSRKGGGVNSLLGQLVDEFYAQGNEVTVISPTYKDLPDNEILNGVKYIRVKGTSKKGNVFLNILVGIPYFFRVLKRIGSTDVLHCHLWHGFLFSYFKVGKVKTHTVHRDPKKALKLFKKFNRIYFGSDSVCEDAKKILPNLNKKLKTVYNCVDFKDYSNHSYRSPDRKIKFLYIGRFSEDKGLESLFNGFKYAFRENPNIELKTIGPLNIEGGSNVELIKKLSNFIQVNNLSECVKITGPIYDRKKLDDQIFECDAIVLPSIYGETLNMVVLESMRIGRAQLISDLEANIPLNIDGVTGYFCKAGDGISWKNNILKMAKKIEDGVGFGKNTYEYGKEKFSSKVVAKEYLNDFRELLKVK